MPAFGMNRYAIPFVRNIRYRRNASNALIGFRLSDRVQSAIDRLYSDLITLYSSESVPVLARWAYVYPFVGATAWTHAMNMADTDGNYLKYEITWDPSTQHTELGIFGGQGNTNADCGTYQGPQAENWTWKSFGFYSRTNNAASEQSMAATTVMQPNGYIYSQHIHPRFQDGNVYFRQCSYQNASIFAGNEVRGSCGFSHGLYSCSRLNGNDLRGTLNGAAYWPTNTTAEQPLGYGNGPSDGTFMMIYPTNRQLAFVFSTKYARTLTPEENVSFYQVVQRFQVGMNRDVPWG